MKKPEPSKKDAARAKANNNVANDLDDLDDLMGGSGPPSQPQHNDFDADEDDDFFGMGSSTKKKDTATTRTKQDAADPLAFLQRAQAEKRQAATKKAMAQQQAAAEWKTKEQLAYNLNSEFMDFEDKWKQALGPDLYKDRATSLAVDPSMRQRII